MHHPGVAASRVRHRGRRAPGAGEAQHVSAATHYANGSQRRAGGGAPYRTPLPNLDYLRSRTTLSFVKVVDVLQPTSH